MSWSSGIQLRVVEGPGEGETTHLNYDRMTLGRARVPGSRADGWVLMPDKAISRRHAELVWDDKVGAYILHHLSKTNLTWVDGEPLNEPVALRLGLKIRMGGTTLLAEPAQEPTESAQTDTPKPTGHEMTEKLHVEGLGRKIALKEGETLCLRVDSGPQAGREFPLTGFYITVGRGNQQADVLTKDPKAPRFDQMLELTDPSVHPNHLLLKWEELKGGYSTFKNPTAPAVPLRRHVDGCHWQAQITDNAALLREGDTFVIGSSTICLAKPGQAQPEPKKQVPLERPDPS